MKKGKVYLVGAGPGDAGLITVNGMNAIKKADVIVYDRLANPKLLKYNQKSAKLVYVGKASKEHTMKQEDISQLLVDEALAGKTVVRLKGGDPYVFGRGGEEGQLLYQNNVDFEIIPGITSGIGGLAYAGIPITHRDHASSLHLITGHLKSEEDELNYDALAKLDGTLVFYMGVANLKNIAKGLCDSGKDPKTPVALISWATHPSQKTITTTLDEIINDRFTDEVRPPSLIAVGTVINLKKELDFFESKPLHSKRVIVTRARNQASSLVEALEDLGAMVIECPSIKIVEKNNNELKEAIAKLDSYTHLVFTSQNGVRIFMEELLESFDVRKLSHLKIASIGEATSKELLSYGIKYDLMPKRFVAEELGALLLEEVTKDSKILLPRAEGARDILIKMLEDKCTIDEVKIYKSEIEELDEETRNELLDGADYITFTSSSTVSNFYEMIDENILKKLEETKIISIGPITSETIKEHGKKVHAQAESYSIDGVLETILMEAQK